MSTELNYPYLLAVHALCVDGQLHQNELQFLQSLAKNVGVDAESDAAAELILAQADEHLGLEDVLQRIIPEQRSRALSLTALASHFDGTLDRTEQRLLERLKQQWQVSDDLYAQILDLAKKEAQRLIADLKTAARGTISTGAKVLSGLETVLGKTVIDRVVSTLGTESMKERIQDYRIEALLSGPKYEKAIEECRDVGLRDIEVADTCLHATAQALKEIGAELDSKIAEIQARIGDKPAQAAREALRSMKDDRAEIERVINQELQEFQALQIKKRRAMNFYTIAFMGRSKAGKSTLHAVVTGGGWDQIGVGRQNTTRLNRVYEWHNIRIIDTPGIATPGGEELEKVAESIIDEADLICFVVTNNNQQTSEFEFLKQLRNKGKPLLVLLNVKEDLSHPVRLKRFLDKPDQAFSDDKDRLGGHIDRIRRDAAEHYGTSNFPIIPVQLLAAQIAQQQPEHEHAETLMKASRLQHFLDSVRLSLLDEGLLRRSQNLLGSTVADIERPCRDVKARSEFYLNFSKQIRGRARESAQRLKKAQEDHARQLEQDLRGVFAALQREVPDFAEDHWDDSESYLNDAWSDEIRRFGMEKKIQGAQEKAIEAFSSDMTDLLEEVGRELTLNRRLAINTGNLNEQDSSAWAQQSSKWGSGILGVAGSIAFLIPGGQIIGGIMIGISVVLGVLASLFESKASKRRKAVAKISSALESQIEKQEKQIVEAALKHFSEQCLAGAAAVQDYFRLSADGLAFVGHTLNCGAETLQVQSSILNTHFAARILDFAGNSPSESSAQALRAQIHEVRRKVGESIDIEVAPKMRTPKNLNIVESVIQEKITLQKAGV
ncbi:MAG: 50S ribosome-binding GTPase [Burkholderiaceae bacterium]|nr:50S ribosome-binding GTPase [Burkholderiaceae bacterium]